MSLCLAPFAFAQSEGNLPPAAAPTSRVVVDSIPVVRSQAEKAGDYVSGLLRGLRADERVQGIAVAVVQSQHPPLDGHSGSLDGGARIPAGGIARALYAVSIMQLVEGGRLKPDQDLGTLLNDNLSGVSLTALMTGQGGDTATIVRVIEKVSGEAARDFVGEHIFRPLGMGASSIENGDFRTSVADMERFAAALVNGGAGEKTAIMQPKSVEALENAAPERLGWSFGLPDMHRNGWRALQLDGSAGGLSSRLVIAPDAKLAYVLVVQGRGGTRFWRTLDDGLFDELLPPSAGVVVPDQPDSRLVTGTYEPDGDLRSLVFLKFPKRDLRVSAGSDGSLILSGAENAVLLPASGGSWSSQDGNLSATYRGDELFLSSGVAYRPVAFYKRPVLYALLALLAALVTIGAVLFGSIPLPWIWFGARSRDKHPSGRSTTYQERSI